MLLASFLATYLAFAATKKSADPEKRAALEAWGRRMETIVTGASGTGQPLALRTVIRSRREIGLEDGAER